MSFILYKETNFKETPIGKIPREWEVKKLVEVINCVKGRKPKKLHDRKASEMFLPYLTAEYMRGLEEPKWCNPQEDQKLARVEEGDVIMIWDGSYAGHVFTGFNGILASTMIKIVPNQKVNGKFLYYFLAKNFHVFRGTTTGTGIPHVNKKVFDEFLVPIPSLKEQQKIAEILSTVDEAIRKTSEIIAKTERLKKGLMQELLTKGIGHKEFKDTEVGRIPKDWEVEKLGNIAEIIMGQSPPSSTYNREGKGLPFLQGKREFGDIHPSPILYCSQPIKIAEPNDILISVRAPVGDVNVARYRLCIGRGLAAIRFNLNRASHWFYFYYFQKIKNFLENLGKGSTFKAITMEDLGNLKVPYPSFFEQQKIAEILFAIDKKLAIDRNEKAKLERIKQGLMDLLLTGKIRVKVN
jgi:type I restriction enzyme S subunit